MKNTTPVECMLIGGPLNGKRGPIYGNDHCVDLELYDAAGNVTSIERYELGNKPTPTFRYYVGSYPYANGSVAKLGDVLAEPMALPAGLGKAGYHASLPDVAVEPPHVASDVWVTGVKR